MEHGYSIVIPPHFDGNNYAYWKVKMKAFLKCIDERVWNFVEYGWEKPTTPVSEWQTFQKETVAFNSKVIPIKVRRNDKRMFVFHDNRSQ